MGRDVQLEYYDYNFYNNRHRPMPLASHSRFLEINDLGQSAGSLYSEDGVDYYNIGTVNAGETIFVNTRLPSLSTLSPAIEIRDDRDFYWNERAGRSFDGVAEVPVTETRTFYALIRPNSGDGIRGQYLLDVQILPTGSLDFPDLLATEVTGPEQAESGEEISVSWTVSNVGHAGTTLSGWSDQIFLSADEILGNGDDVFLGSFDHSGVLDVNDSYQQTQTVRLSDGISGGYYIVVKVDSENAVNEFALEGNNVTVSENSTQVTLAPYADLIVSSVSAPDLVIGDPAEAVVSWTVENQGTGAGRTSEWTDRIVLSSNPDYGDADDQIVAEFMHSGVLDVGENYSRSEVVTLPAGLHARYHVFVVTDSAHEVYEYDFESNNFAEADDLLAVAPSHFRIWWSRRSRHPRLAAAGRR